MVDETTPDSENPDEGQLEVTVETADEGASRLRAQLDAMEKEKKELYERLLRTAADLDNVRKRTRKEIDDARVKAKEDVLKEILPGIDNLERAISAAGKEGGAESIVEGVKLVLRQFLTALERVDVKAFEAIGQPFDPARHEAISHLETDTQPAGTVASELQRGYVIGSRLLRPALVAVAKAPAGKDEGQG